MISIAMTTYNGEKYLSEQLDSILNQTCSDFELVVCDDCSKDATRTMLSEYQKKDARIKLHFNEKNLGFKKNFEKAVSFCTGDYIAFSDQDDVWNTDKLELCLSKIGDHDLICTDAEVTDEKLNPLGFTMGYSLHGYVVPDDRNELLKSLIHNNYVQGATILAKGDFIRRYLPIPDDCMFHDWYYAICAAINDGFVYLKETTVKYRQHQDNVSGGKKNTFTRMMRPVAFDREKVIKECNQGICYINLIRPEVSDENMKAYLDDSEKYYRALASKEFYTLRYINKYYKYLYFDYSFLKKKIMLFKRFLGVVRYKMCYRGKGDNGNR